jgi:hypothetical protein
MAIQIKERIESTDKSKTIMISIRSSRVKKGLKERCC